MITLQEKIEAMEFMISEYRWMQSQPEIYRVLKAIDQDLRARQDGAIWVTELELGRRINAVQLSRSQKAGNLGERLSALGQETIARWPVIQAALARFSKVDVEER